MAALPVEERSEYEDYLNQYKPLLRQYVAQKLKNEGEDWLWSIVFPGDGFCKLPGRHSPESRLASARQTAQSMLGISASGGSVREWLREWPTDYGLQELRAGVERLVNPKRQFSDKTRGRYNELYKKSGFKTHDDFVNHLLTGYAQKC